MSLAPRPGHVHDVGPDEQTWTFIDEGTKRVLYPDMIDAAATRAIRAETGMSWAKVLQMFADDGDIDLMSILIWVARCQAGEDIDFATVDAGVSYKSNIEWVKAEEAPMEPDHPLS